MPRVVAFCCAVFLLMCAELVAAQPYSTAVGIRFGAKAGLSAQQAIGLKYTVELMGEAGLYSKQTSFTALLQRHQKLLLPGVNFYHGVGPHVGFRSVTVADGAKTGNARVGFGGLSALAGAELKMGKTVLSVDYKPAVNFWGGSSSLEGGVAFSIRYILVKAKRKLGVNLPKWLPARGVKA
jgi:hypothetical protein